MGIIDDERHLVFECAAFDWLRASRRELFSARVGLDMKRFMEQGDQQGVFWHVLNCLREVEDLADVDRSLDVDVGIPMEFDTYDSE